MWESEDYAGDRAGATLQVEVKQVVGVQQVCPALSSSSFHWFYINLILKVQQAKDSNSNPPNMSGKLGTGTFGAPVMHRLLPPVQQAMTLECSLGQVLMLGQLSCLLGEYDRSWDTTEVAAGTLVSEGMQWVGAHLCICKTFSLCLFSRQKSLNPMNSDTTSTSQSPCPVFCIGTMNLD